MKTSSAFRAALLGATAVGLVVVAVLAARIGPWIGRPQGSTELPSLPSLPSLPTLPTVPTLPSVQQPTGPSAFDPTLLLIVLGVVLALVLVVLGYLWWRDRRRPAPTDEEPDPVAPVHPLPTESDGDLPFDARAAADHIVACWQWVEASAAQAGAPRRAEQTPTEFLAALTVVHPVDPHAAADLLRMYHHARFDHVALGPESAELARRSATVVAAGLQMPVGGVG